MRNGHYTELTFQSGITNYDRNSQTLFLARYALKYPTENKNDEGKNHLLQTGLLGKGTQQ